MFKKTIFFTIAVIAIFADDEISSTPKIVEQMKVIPDQLKPAAPPERFLKPEDNFQWVDFSAYGGLLNGTSKESYKFSIGDDSTLTSEYEWDLNRVWIVGGKAKLNIYEDYLYLTMDGWNKVSATNSDMVERNSFDPISVNSSNISWTNSKLNNAYQFTTELTCKFLSFNIGYGNFKIGSLFGYEYMRFDWSNLGGTYYPNDSNRLGGINKSINFEEKIVIPYFGFLMTLNSTIRFVQMDFFARISPYASIKDSHSRLHSSMSFEKEFLNAKYFNLGFSMCSHIWKGLYFDMKYYYEQLVDNFGKFEFKMEGLDPSQHEGGIRTFHSHSNLSYGLSVLF